MRFIDLILEIGVCFKFMGVILMDWISKRIYGLD